MDFNVKKEDFYRALFIGLLYAILRFGMTYYQESVAFDALIFVRDFAIGAAISLVLGIIFPKAK